MKKSILTLALLTAPLAFSASNNATTMDQETVSSDTHLDTNSNARFDNRDPRTNSRSTPATMGAEESRLDPDITSNKYVDPASEEDRMAGSTTSWEEEPSDITSTESDSRLSGTSTDATSSTSTGTTDNSTMATGAAAGAGAGAAASETSASAKKDKKSKKAKTHHHKSGSATSNESTVYPKSSSSDVTDSYNRSGSSTMDSVSGSSRSANTAGAAATGAAAGAAAGSALSADSNYNKNVTAQDTSSNQNDTEMVRKIRSEITDNKDLSVNAHNIKIISQNGRIILKGQVADANEKMKVEEIAKRVAGNTQVTNQTIIDSRSGSSTNK